MDEAKGFRLGAADYITKPFHPPIVLARVKTHMELKAKSDRLEQLASIDGLTNLYNRRRFDEMLNLEWRRALRSQAPLSLTMIDIDFFKLFNDTYGHANGDQCLKDVAYALHNCLARPADIIARYGGEEFVALLPETAGESAEIIAHKMRDAVERLKILHMGSEVSQFVTISAGVATAFTHPGIDSPEDLLKAADAALYKSKKTGRNKVISHNLSALKVA
jgi:diguanylate cyclase (GGDEF)-like protein